MIAIDVLRLTPEQIELLTRLSAWSMNDIEWRAAGCPPPGSLAYALKALEYRPLKELKKFMAGK